MKVFETFLKCPNCNGFKNANFTKKDKQVKAVCKCGTSLVEDIENIKIKK